MNSVVPLQFETNLDRIIALVIYAELVHIVPKALLPIAEYRPLSGLSPCENRVAVLSYRYGTLSDEKLKKVEN